MWNGVSIVSGGNGKVAPGLHELRAAQWWWWWWSSVWRGLQLSTRFVMISLIIVFTSTARLVQICWENENWLFWCHQAELENNSLRFHTSALEHWLYRESPENIGSCINKWNNCGLWFMMHILPWADKVSVGGRKKNTQWVPAGFWCRVWVERHRTVSSTGTNPAASERRRKGRGCCVRAGATTMAGNDFSLTAACVY